MTPCIDLADPAVCADPLAAYRRAQEAAPVVTLTAPGLRMYAITRHRDARAMLADPRFAPARRATPPAPTCPTSTAPTSAPCRSRTARGTSAAPRRRPGLHPAPRRAVPARIAELVDGLLADIPTDNGTLDLLDGLARPLPMAVICAVIGVPAADRPRWHGYGALVSAGDGKAFAAAIPAIIDDAKAVLAAPEDGLVTDLVRTGALDDTEIVTLIWHLVLAGQVPTQLLAVGLDALLRRPDQLAAALARPPPPSRSCCAGAARNCSRCPASRAWTSTWRAYRSPRAPR